MHGTGAKKHTGMQTSSYDMALHAAEFVRWSLDAPVSEVVSQEESNQRHDEKVHQGVGSAYQRLLCQISTRPALRLLDIKSESLVIFKKAI